MNPFEVFEKGAKLNPDAAKLLIIGPLAAAALALAFKLFENQDFPTVIIGLIILIVTIVVVGVLIRLLSKFDSLESTIVWFVRFCLFLFALVSVLFVTSAFAGWPQPLACVVRPFETCSRLAGNEIGKEAPLTEPVRKGTEDQKKNDEIRSKYTVYIQFAGYPRDPVADLRKILSGYGWTVPREERIANAAGLNEVRFRSDSDRPAADLLALEITKAQPKMKNIKARKIDVIKQGTLEVWVSQ